MADERALILASHFSSMNEDGNTNLAVHRGVNDMPWMAAASGGALSRALKRFGPGRTVNGQIPGLGLRAALCSHHLLRDYDDDLTQTEGLTETPPSSPNDAVQQDLRIRPTMPPSWRPLSMLKLRRPAGEPTATFFYPSNL